ncbi:colanic acid biosynthesis glycosyltransferase WcaL [Aliifodinibius halophilus]|uniref:Colanic acid biosynthesis glycosyltransferase WcaL n=1 Tax=Fodinibius halophilus TaxID=1736908 RepID=A0A6M1TCP2_9BACT|nr:colanic acid biosynthesis glycosyltransferase WcaL [Fodinibius halophilus]
MDSVGWTPPVFSRKDKLPRGILEADSLVMWMIGYYPSFFIQMKKKNIDLIHAHFGPMGYLCSELASQLNIPLVTTFYGYDATQLPEKKSKWKKKYQRLFDKGERFLVEGPAMKKKLERLGCPSAKIVVHHLGVELDHYEVRSSYSEDKELKILMAGRFVEKKGFIHGLKAFHKFRKKGGEGTLTLIGDSSGTAASERVKEDIIQYIRSNGLEEVVNLVGMVPLEELREEYYKHNLFLAPSVEAEDGDNEGGAPVTTIEASATGLPVIGSRHGDIPEVVEDQKTGLIAEEKDVKTLATHLYTLYEQTALRKQMGQAAALRMKSQFNAEMQGQKLAQIYEECLDS